MAVLPIRISGDPVLHSPARPVEEIDDGTAHAGRTTCSRRWTRPGRRTRRPAGRRPAPPLRLQLDATRTASQHRGVAINPELWLTPPRSELPDEDDGVGGLPVDPGRAIPAAPLRRGSSCSATDLDGELVRGSRRRLARADLPARVRPPRRHAVRRSARRTACADGGEGACEARLGRPRARPGCRGATTSRTDSAIRPESRRIPSRESNCAQDFCASARIASDMSITSRGAPGYAPPGSHGR